MATEANINNFKFSTPISIRFADIDQLGHVNNAIYLTYFEIARSRYWQEVIDWDWTKVGVIIGKAEINFLHPLHLNDQLTAYVKTARLGNSSFDLHYLLTLKQTEDEKICCSGSTTCVAFDYQLSKPVAIPDHYRQIMQNYDQASI